MEWLNRFTDVMDCLSSNPNMGMGVSELARETNLSKGTIHRMLTSMCEYQLVIQDNASKQYYLGPKTMLWGSQFLRLQDPIKLLGRYGEKLSNETNLYTFISRFHGGDVYCVYTHQPSDLRNKYFVHVGQRMPIHSAAAAKVIVAYQEEAIIEKMLQETNFEAATPFTKTNPIQIKEELQEIYQSQLAFCIEELEMGVSAISAPIFYDDKKTNVSISIVGASDYMEIHQESLRKQINEVAQDASEYMKSMHLLSSIRL
ncbi:IclR family transcriptional regulator [Niallia sp. FSL W8-0635]|uniref:IclR family transcriptional regulator n=1 Tax=Niallia sp. FSL W8-0635 TaxID=2975337 RepID=UPI0030F91219